MQDGILVIVLILSSWIVCINLDRRRDRWDRMQQKFSQHGIEPVQRFPALDGNGLPIPANWTHSAGAYGCLRSHVEVVKEARRRNVPSVLIFEDDAVFDPDFQNKFAKFNREVPDDWDMLYLGALHKDEPARISNHVARITKANSTFAYAIKHTVYDEFIDLNSKAEHVLDMNSYVLQQRFNCYCFMPNLAWVETEYSDVQNRLERHWYLEESLVLFGAEVDRLLNQTTIVLVDHDDPKNLEFLTRYYAQYFYPRIEIVTAIENADPRREYFIVLDSDIYIETLDIRANLRICEEYDGATGFYELIELTGDQARLLRETGLSRGINVTGNPSSKNAERCCFVNRRVLENPGNHYRIFQSPNHALRLPRG